MLDDVIVLDSLSMLCGAHTYIKEIMQASDIFVKIEHNFANDIIKLVIDTSYDQYYLLKVNKSEFMQLASIASMYPVLLHELSEVFAKIEDVYKKPIEELTYGHFSYA